MATTKITNNIDGGFIVEADDPAAAVKAFLLLRAAPTETKPAQKRERQIAPAGPSSQPPPEPHADEPTDPWTAFLRGLTPGQFNVLRFVRENPNALLKDLAAAVAGGKETGVTGFLRGLYRNGERHGFKKTALLKRSENGTGRRRIIRYAPGRTLTAKGLPEGGAHP
jgi:hypothetical protein